MFKTNITQVRLFAIRHCKDFVCSSSNYRDSPKTGCYLAYTHSPLAPSNHPHVSQTMNKPNILIFMTDHQRGDTALHSHPCLMPHVKRLAREGVTFTETFCPTPHCCPSRATFMTGLYPTRHGVWNNICIGQALSSGLKPGVRCWSEDLADAGYRLAYSGKWHVSVEESPADRGWQEYHVTAGKKAFHGQRWEHYRDLAAKPEPTDRSEGEILRPGYGVHRTYAACEGADQGDETTVTRALDAMDDLTRGDQPWCLYVGCNMPHDPYFVPQRYLDMYPLEDVPLPPSYADAMEDKPAIVQRQRSQIWGQLTEREIREAIRHYWAMCTYLDELFGRLLAKLDAVGQTDNTLVLYCSDHGDYCGDHGLFAKGIPCYRGAYHVPAVVRWPAGIRQPGRQVDAFVSLADFGPTFSELCGTAPDTSLTGRSLVPFLVDEAPEDWRDAIFTQCNGVELYYTQRSVTTKEWKYVFNGFDRDELYNLRDDPHEMKNLAADPAHRDIVRQMCRRLWRFAQREQDSATNAYITVGLVPFGPAEAFRED